jgi:hypothetical protein
MRYAVESHTGCKPLAEFVYSVYRVKTGSLVAVRRTPHGLPVWIDIRPFDGLETRIPGGLTAGGSDLILPLSACPTRPFNASGLSHEGP